jgi:cobalt-zinc-cadmium efflux system outer membrane protein
MKLNWSVWIAVALAFGGMEILDGAETSGAEAKIATSPQPSPPAEREKSSLGANEMSVETLVKEALSKNPELNYYKAEIAAARGERRNAGTLANPELSSQVGVKHARDAQTGLSGEGLAWSVSVLQTFEYPGRLSLRKAIANRQIELAEIGYAQFRAALAGKTRSAAFAVFEAQEKAVAAEEVAARFVALSEVLVQREPAGVTPLLETRIVEANAVTAQRRASEAKQAARVALVELNQLRGQPASAVARIARPELAFERVESMERLLDRAATNSFDLRMRQVELTQQGFKVSLAKNERYPSISVGPYYSHEESGQVAEKQRIAGVAVSVPLPLWNRNTGNIEAARAREEQATTSLRLAQREVERKVVENAAAYEARLDEMSHWKPEASGKLREAAEVADRHYRLGAVPVATYVELQKQYLEAVEAILDTKHDALQAAQELEILTGLSFLKAAATKSSQ